MSDSGFGSELTKQGPPTSIHIADLTADALNRNRRRIRSLSGLTIGLWILTFLIVPALWMPFAAMMNRESDALARMTQNPPVQTMDLATTLINVLNHISRVSAIVLTVLTVASLLAAMSTIWLVLTVRRVTLEQLSAGLAQISDQLRKLEGRA